MNSSISHADATTHLKIVAIALLASVTVVWIGIFAHVASPQRTTSAPVTAGHSVVAGVPASRS